MNRKGFLKSEGLAWLFGGFALIGLICLAFSYLQWLGVGLIGVAGLVITSRLDMHDGLAVPDDGHGSGAVPLLARQLHQRNAQSSPEQKMATAEQNARRTRILYIINTVMVGIAAYGIGLFFLHQV